MNEKKQYPTKRPFLYYLLIFIFSIIAVLIVGITIGDFIITEQNYQDNVALLRKQTEANIIEIIRIVDLGLKIFDDSLNTEME